MSESEQTLAADLPAGPGARILRREDAASWMDGYRFLEKAKEAYDAEYARGYADGKSPASPRPPVSRRKPRSTPAATCNPCKTKSPGSP